MNSQVRVRRPRRILCVFPRYAPSFGTFQHAYPLMDGVRAFMPPQGILVIAAYLPSGWEVRLVDENIRPATRQDLDWADAVFVSGMHVQKAEIIGDRAARSCAGKAAVLGGPSVSASSGAVFRIRLSACRRARRRNGRADPYIDDDITPARRAARFRHGERLPLSDFPIPAYELIDGRRYFLGNVQFSSGCPYRASSATSPALYGRQPRLKAPEQILGELDAMLAAGIAASVYFVDDNFIGNQKAARDLAAATDRLATTARLSGAIVPARRRSTSPSYPDILAMMREAYFCTVFCGIETPEPKPWRRWQIAQPRHAIAGGGRQ